MKNVITREKVLAAIRNLNGQVFGATFVKANGELRKMSARMGVGKGVKGTGYSHTRDLTRRNITVFDMRNGFRAIPVDRLIFLKISGQTYKVI